MLLLGTSEVPTYVCEYQILDGFVLLITGGTHMYGFRWVRTTRFLFVTEYSLVNDGCKHYWFVFLLLTWREKDWFQRFIFRFRFLIISYLYYFLEWYLFHYSFLLSNVIMGNVIAVCITNNLPLDSPLWRMVCVLFLATYNVHYHICLLVNFYPWVWQYS